MTARLLTTLLMLVAAVPAARAARADESLRTRASLIQAEDERDPQARVLVKALDHDDAELRARALRALGRIGSETHVALVASALTDRVPAVRHEAAFALGEIESMAAFDSLRHALTSPDPELAGLAAEALSKIDWKDEQLKAHAGSAVAHALLSDRSVPPAARHRALLSAWRLGRQSPGLVESLLALDEHPAVLRTDLSEALVYCAARLGDPRLAPLLSRAAATAPTSFARSHAARGLGALAAAARTAGQAPDEGARALLVELAQAQRDFASLRVREEDEAIVVEHATLPPTGVRIAALRALSSFPAPADRDLAMEPLASALTSTDHHLLTEAIALAGRWRVAAARPLLKGMLTLDGQPDLQADALAALVAIDGRAALDWCERFAASNDWRLRAAAASALGEPHGLGSSGERGSRLLDELLLDGDARVVARAVSAVAESERPDAVVLVLAQLTCRDPIVRALAATTLPGLVAEAFGQDEAEAVLRAVARAGDEHLPETSRFSSLEISIRLLGEESRGELEQAFAAGELGPDLVMPLIARRLGRLSFTRHEAEAALRHALEQAAGEVPADARLLTLEALVELLGAEAEDDLASALRDPELTVRLAAARFAEDLGLAVLANSPVSTVGTGRSFDEYLEAARQEREGRPRRLHLITERGLVDVELLPAEAVLTVRRLLELARSGFYDGLAFHRVVADFVVQGGDPRGDGWGGPAESLRCEINPLRYERGTVGMALSGKDTGGSQFFVSLSPQPHLDGGYTVFGRVGPESMRVVERLRRHDRILAAVPDDLLADRPAASPR